MFYTRTLRRSDDFTALVVLSRDFFSEYQSHHTDFFKVDELKDQDILDYFASFCGQKLRKAFIALDDGRMVGYLTAYVKRQADYWHYTRIGEISGLMVAKDYRTLGIGERLLECAKAFFQARGLAYYIVYTAVANQAGVNFYLKNGLQPLYTTFLGSTCYTDIHPHGPD
jgi:ribosomal protein S18 acetylase RimI-like enzyme